MSDLGGYFESLDDPRYDAFNREIDGLLGNLPYFYQIPTELISEDVPAASGAPWFPFRHALSKTGAENGLGLRLYIMPPDVSMRTTTAHLGRSGIIQTGDLLLSFRQGTTGTGNYQHIQLGLTHTGVAVVRNGAVYNIDSPLAYSGRLTHEHYTEAQLMLHVIRPRYTDQQRQNLQQWAEAMMDDRATIVPKIKFATDYGAPNFPEEGLDQVFNLGQIIASGGARGRRTAMYCSEFAWTFCALRDSDLSDPAVRRTFETGTSSDTITRKSLLWEPMPVLGSALHDPENGEPGLSDGIGLVLRSLEVSPDKLNTLLEQAFSEWEPHFSGGRPPYAISSGHREQARNFAPMYEPLKSYFRAALLQDDPATARQIHAGISAQLQGQENYSPTGFLTQALRPIESSRRLADYVGTLAFPTERQYGLIAERFPEVLRTMAARRPATMGGPVSPSTGPEPSPRTTEDALLRYKDGFRGARFSERPRVKTLQAMLQALHLDIGRAGIDGMYGKSTADALREFGEARGIDTDGLTLTRPLLDALTAAVPADLVDDWPPI